MAYVGFQLLRGIGGRLGVSCCLLNPIWRRSVLKH